MGLLDLFSGRDDEGRTQGLLSTAFSGSNADKMFNDPMLNFGLRMMANSGPSLRPIGFGQAAGNAYIGAMGDHQEQRKNQRKELLENMQIQQMLSKAKREQGIQDFIADRFKKAGNMPAAEMNASTQALNQGAQFGSVGPTVGNAQRMDAIMPPNQRQASRQFPFSLDEITQFQAIGGPDLLNHYKTAITPIHEQAGFNINAATGQRSFTPKVPEGFTVGADGSASLMPGYSQSNATIKGEETAAQELAKSRFDPVYSLDEKGNKVLFGSRADALGYGGAGMPQPGVPRPGQQGTPRGGPIIAERSASASAYDNQMAKDYAERYSNISKAGFSASSQIAKLNRIGKLLDDYDGSVFSTRTLELAKIANQAGFNVDPKLGNKEAAQALSNELALAARDPSQGSGMPGALSNSDRDFLASMTPNLAQSASGRMKLIQSGVSIQQRNQKIAEMAAKYQKKYGRVDDGFYTQLQEWAERNQLFGGNK